MANDRKKIWRFLDIVFPAILVALWISGIILWFLLYTTNSKDPLLIAGFTFCAIAGMILISLSMVLHITFLNPWFILPKQMYHEKLHPQESAEIPLRRETRASGSFDTRIEWYHGLLYITVTDQRLIIQTKVSWRSLCLVNAPFDEIERVEITNRYGFLRRRTALMILFKREKGPKYFALACKDPDVWAELFTAHGVPMGHTKEHET